MTKKSDLRLDREPINMQPEEKETLSQRLEKLQQLLIKEQNTQYPCLAYIEDLNTSIEFLKERNINV